MKKGLKSAFEDIKLSRAAKRRIEVVCAEEISARGNVRHYNIKKTMLAAVCVVLLVGTAVSVLAATGYLRLPVHNTSHLSGVSSPMYGAVTSNDEASAEGEYVISCNGVMGDADLVYFDVTVKRVDGEEIFVPENGTDISRFDAVDAYLQFSDGYKKEMLFLMLGDSTDYEYHFEGSALFYNDEKQYLNQEAEIHVGGIKVTLSSGESVVVCEFDESINAIVSVNLDTNVYAFDEGEFCFYNDEICIEKILIEASKVTMWGECMAEGVFYGLQEILESAILVTADGEISLGNKTSVGNLPDGRFEIQWLSANVVIPDEIIAIKIDEKTISID